VQCLLPTTDSLDAGVGADGRVSLQQASFPLDAASWPPPNGADTPATWSPEIPTAQQARAQLNEKPSPDEFGPPMSASEAQRQKEVLQLARQDIVTPEEGDSVKGPPGEYELRDEKRGRRRRRRTSSSVRRKARKKKKVGQATPGGDSLLVGQPDLLRRDRSGVPKELAGMDWRKMPLRWLMSLPWKGTGKALGAADALAEPGAEEAKPAEKAGDKGVHIDIRMPLSKLNQQQVITVGLRQLDNAKGPEDQVVATSSGQGASEQSPDKGFASLTARATSPANSSILDASLSAKGGGSGSGASITSLSGAAERCLPGATANPVEKSRTYSSVFKNGGPGSRYARSMLDSPLAWVAAKNASGEWMTLDLARVHRVRGLLVQGNADRKSPRWVRRFRLMYSLDGKVYNSAGEFRGNSDAHTKVERRLESPVKARFVRLVVLGWHGHISMRAGVLLCGACVAGPVQNPGESSRVYSSTLPGTLAHSWLGSASGWQPLHSKAGEWMTIDLGSPATVRGVLVQGLNKAAKSPRWVTKFGVHYSLDNTVFKNLSEEFGGNWDSDTKVKHLFMTPFRAQYVRIVALGWHGNIGMRAAVLTCQSCLRGPDLDPPEESRSYSSTSGTASSMLDSSGSWSPQHNRKKEWMSIDLGSLQDVRGTVVQCGPESKCVNQWKVKYSEDGTTFLDVGEDFYGTALANTKYRRSFATPVKARYVRLLAEGWQGGISMRAGVETCQDCAQETLDPEESLRTYSSVLSNSAQGHGHARSRLASPSAWSAARSRPGEYMTIDLGKAATVRGTLVQGRHSPRAWVTQYYVKTSLDGKQFKLLPGVFEGPPSGKGHAYRPFREPVKARYVRLIAWQWHSHISMRAGVLVCKDQSGVW